MYSNVASCITNHAHWSDGTLCSEPRYEIKVRQRITYLMIIACCSRQSFVFSNHLNMRYSCMQTRTYHFFLDKDEKCAVKKKK